jgi:hypothetical protein
LDTADDLIGLAFTKIRETSSALSLVGLGASAFNSNEETTHHYDGQIIHFAKQHGYLADTGTYRAWAKLSFETLPRTQLILHFHSRGKDFLGVVACVAIFEMIEPAESDQAAQRQSLDFAMAPFEFYFTETTDQVKERFSPWLDEVLALALAQAQRFL